MPSVKDETPMARNVIAPGADEPDERPSRPSEQPPNRLGGSGFFHIYKKGQGKWTRLGTVFGAGLIGALTAFNLYQYLTPYIHARNTIIGICAAFLAVFALVVFWLMNKPNNADFLIATDSEMKKVNWTTQGELMGSTRVVILFIIFIAIFLFLMDIFFAEFFHLIGVLRTGPFQS